MIQGEAKKLWTRVSTIDNFFVKFRRRSESSWTESSVASDSRTFILRDLLCGSEYEFVLLVSSRVGNSSASNTVTAKTKGSPPEYLPQSSDDGTESIAVSTTSSTIFLSQWQDRGCHIQQFIFGFRTADSDDWIIAGAESPPQDAFLLGGLQAATSYVIRVTAINVAGSSQKEYNIRTDGLPHDYSGHGGRGESLSLAPLFADPRVAVPIAASVLAIFLTAITLLLRYRYRTAYVRPPSQLTPAASNNIRTYQDDTTDASSTLSGKRNMTGLDGVSDYGDDVSPYAVFPMPMKSYSNSTRRMKTFVVEKHHPVVEMSNYAPPISSSSPMEEPTYDYIAPCGAGGGGGGGNPEREFRPRRVMVPPKLNPHSVFVPIPARPHHSGSHSSDSGTWNHHHRMPSDWNNQETLVMSQRL